MRVGDAIIVRCAECWVRHKDGEEECRRARGPSRVWEDRASRNMGLSEEEQEMDEDKG